MPHAIELKNMDERSAPGFWLHFNAFRGATPSARMQIKESRLLSDPERFFRFESLLELLHTKNVVEVSVLRCAPEKSSTGPAKEADEVSGLASENRRDRFRDLA